MPAKHYRSATPSHIAANNSAISYKQAESLRSSKKPRLRGRMVRALAILLVVAGIGVGVFPLVMQWLYARNAEAGEQQFVEEASDLVASNGASGNVDLEGLLAAMRAYNQRLCDEGQSGLVDAWSYEEPSFCLADWGLDSEVVAYLDVPRMGVTLPVFLGATEENMLAGAVHLSQTSLPIGSWEGSSVNTVIAAHRNHWSAGMFHDIEKMQVGDPVYVQNLWERLEYRVVETRIIDPSDIDAVKIQQGRDMLTLVTCHPLYHNYQRYVVFCERVT